MSSTNTAPPVGPAMLIATAHVENGERLADVMFDRYLDEYSELLVSGDGDGLPMLKKLLRWADQIGKRWFEEQGRFDEAMELKTKLTDIEDAIDYLLEHSKQKDAA